MAEPASIVAVRRFVALVMHGDPPSTAQLARALDELVASVHTAPEGAPAGLEIEPPQGDFSSVYASIEARFPNLGLYASADTLALPPAAALVGDAIDDLADIIGDLSEVLWRCENLGVEDAHWHLRWLFGVHWGLHARELSLYLHVKLFGGS